MENLNDEQMKNAASENVSVEQNVSNQQEGPSLVIESSIADILPSMVKETLSKMSESKQQQFVEEYKRKKVNGSGLFFPASLLGYAIRILRKVGASIRILVHSNYCHWFLLGIIPVICPARYCARCQQRHCYPNCEGSESYGITSESEYDTYWGSGSHSSHSPFHWLD